MSKQFFGRNRPNRVDFETVNRAALAVLPSVVVRLLPNGHVVGGEYLVLNPRRADNHLGSFKVRLTGARAGHWADFASGDKGGDPVSLVAYLKGISQSEAARKLTWILGLTAGSRR